MVIPPSRNPKFPLSPCPPSFTPLRRAGLSLASWQDLSFNGASQSSHFLKLEIRNWTLEINHPLVSLSPLLHSVTAGRLVTCFAAGLIIQWSVPRPNRPSSHFLKLDIGHWTLEIRNWALEIRNYPYPLSPRLLVTCFVAGFIIQWNVPIAPRPIFSH
jgi:hypothetical protein